MKWPSGTSRIRRYLPDYIPDARVGRDAWSPRVPTTPRARVWQITGGRRWSLAVIVFGDPRKAQR